MLKKIIILIFISLPFGESWRGALAQVNIVPNPSFELLDTCDFNSTVCGGGVNLGVVLYWNTPNNGTSDVYNSCSTHPQCGVPNNVAGYQYPHSGNGYVGGVYYEHGFSSSKEYIQTRLDSILKPQRKYCVNFYVNVSNIYALGTNNIGMYFSTTQTALGNNNLFSLTPQINYTGIVSDTTNWTVVSGQYIANGGEQYIIIGNFYPDAATDTTPSLSPYWGQAYIYVDDVSIEDCTEVGVLHELSMGKEEMKVYPNPATNVITVDVKHSLVEGHFVILNMLGEVVYQKEIKDIKTEIDISSLPKSVYFVEAQSEKGTARKKIV